MSQNTPYEAPDYLSDGFNCPHCHAYANMRWATAQADWRSTIGVRNVPDVEFAQCGRCMKWSIWYAEEMIHPQKISVEDPNIDLPDEVRTDYVEAAIILQASPRGSAAILRLALEKLCNSLVEGKGDLNSKIGTLVSNGLDSKIQKALDAVRVIGNEAVHPGQIDLNDSPEIARQLFKLINLIGQRMITEPAEIDAIYDALPPEKKAGIEARDNK
jgi:hypothetical protein